MMDLCGLFLVVVVVSFGLIGSSFVFFGLVFNPMEDYFCIL